MKSRVKVYIVLALVLTLGLFLLVFLSGINKFDDREVKIINDETIRDSVTSVDLSWGPGTVNFLKSNSKVIRLRETVPLNSDETEGLEFSLENGKLTIKNSVDPSTDSTPHNLDFYVPGTVFFDRFAYEGKSTYFFSENLKSHELACNNIGGEINIIGTFDSIGLKTENGEVKIKEIIMPQSIQVNDISSSVTFTLPKEGLYEVDESNVNGTVEVNFEEDKKKGRNKIYGSENSKEVTPAIIKLQVNEDGKVVLNPY